jgi:hypothetical protein
MKRVLIIDTNREAYGAEDLTDRTLTVGDLIAMLEEFDEDLPVVTVHDNRYTFGAIKFEDVHVTSKSPEGDWEDEDEARW